MFSGQVMTYNVYGKPLFGGQCGQRERLCRIPRWIDDNVPDVEVIGFQVHDYLSSFERFQVDTNVRPL